MTETKKRMKKFITVVFLLAGMQLHAQRWAEKMAETMLSTGIVVEQQNKDHFAKSIYDQSLALKGIEGVWFRTGDKKYFDFIQKTADALVNENGSMKTSPGTGETDALLLGRNLLMLYKVLGKEKYYKAAATLHKQAKSRGGTSAGSLSNQMDLDGWYKSGTFQADWARTFHDAAALDDIASQFKWMERYARDAKSGLLYNVNGNQRTVATFAKNTRSATPFDPCAMAWFGMGLVDVIEHLPETHTGRDSLVQVLGRFATAAVKFQDKKTGLWNSGAAGGPTEKRKMVV
jgi:unsaturated rhamnogalacturonyl hydrolase